MYLTFSYRTSIARLYPEDYIREVIVDVLDYDEHSVNEFVIGRISFYQILCAEIELDDADSEAVYDSHSVPLNRIWRHFMASTRDAKPEFEADHLTRSIIVVNRFLLHPDVAFAAIHICEAALNLFGIDTLIVVSRKEVLPLSEQQLADLTFCKAAETNMIYRHSTGHRTYDDAYPQGKEIFVATSERHEEWVEQEWKKLGL